PDAWTLWLWDSTTGAARAIAHNAVDVTGRAVPGPPNRPLIDHGHVFWVQADADATTNIRMYAIATRVTKLIRRGHPGPPFAMGEMLLWPELHGFGALTTLTAFSLTSLQTVPRPLPLTDVSGETSAAASADTLAWIDATGSELWVWRTAWTSPRLVLQTVDG